MDIKPTRLVLGLRYAKQLTTGMEQLCFAKFRTGTDVSKSVRIYESHESIGTDLTAS